MDDDGLAGFLRARLDEDEARAEAARRVQTEWYVACDDETVTIGALREHIGHCSPARRLREVAAGRAILALHPPKPLRHVEADWCHVCRTGWPCKEFRAIAAVYSDHPDYRPEWKP